MSAELDGARQNAEYAKAIAHPRSAQEALANAILLIVQHLEKVSPR